MPMEKDENEEINVVDQSYSLSDIKLKIINLNSSDC